MQALSPEQYQQLEQLTQAYLREHAHEYKVATGCNPRLGVDALCFVQHDQGLLGAMITPVSLSLVLVPGPETAGADARRIVSLPSGDYPFEREELASGEILWRCELLNDLAWLRGAEEASRLAQQLMRRVMASAEEPTDTGA